MTIYYLSSVDGSDSDDGLSWANAFLTFKYAVETASAAASGPHILYVDSAHSESISGAITVTAAASIRVVCVNRAGGDAPTTGALVGAQATGYQIQFIGTANANCSVYTYGMTFRVSGTQNATQNYATSDTDNFVFESCRFEMTTTNGSPAIVFSSGATGRNVSCRLINCVFKFGATGQRIQSGLGLYLIGCSVDAAGSTPTYLLIANSLGDLTAEGCDFSRVGTALIGDFAGAGFQRLTFVNCKLPSVTWWTDSSTVTTPAHGELLAYNCSSGDAHYVLYHRNMFGLTEVSASIYADDGAQYDGTNRCSWKITTTANGSYFTPYVSPWIDRYHSGTSAISLSLECLRDGNTTVYDNDEVWGEFSFQGNTGSTQADFANDRMALLGTPAAQTASTIAWTGGTTPGKFKLESGSITPAEIGHLRARVVVGEPNITVYVDPTIRIG
jgi:hypothetical protein